jgi:hypothetical protein
LYQRAADGSLQSACPDEAWLERAYELSGLLRLAPGQRCATSVGLGHPHGVVLGVVAPLLTGAAFLRETLRGPSLRGALAGTSIDLLVSLPAQLAALSEGSVPAMRLARVISALDPLPSELSARIAQRLGAPVEDCNDWLVRAPLLRAGEQPQLSDPQDETLLGLVRGFLGVRDAAVLRLEGPDRPSRCIAIVGPPPTDEQSVPLSLVSLRMLVAQHDPRAEVLAVREIRRDALGRFQRDALLRLFGRRPDGSAIRTELRWGEATSSASADYNEYRASVQLPTDCPYFDGHFPGYPILPGAAQLSELVLPLVRRVRPDLGPLRTMTRLKFSGRIQPGETIEVVLRGRVADVQLDFTLRRAQALCAAGSLSFATGLTP